MWGVGVGVRCESRAEISGSSDGRGEVGRTAGRGTRRRGSSGEGSEMDEGRTMVRIGARFEDCDG